MHFQLKPKTSKRPCSLNILLISDGRHPTPSHCRGVWSCLSTGGVNKKLFMGTQLWYWYTNQQKFKIYLYTYIVYTNRYKKITITLSTFQYYRNIKFSMFCYFFKLYNEFNVLSLNQILTNNWKLNNNNKIFSSK